MTALRFQTGERGGGGEGHIRNARPPFEGVLKSSDENLKRAKKEWIEKQCKDIEKGNGVKKQQGSLRHPQGSRQRSTAKVGSHREQQ